MLIRRPVTPVVLIGLLVLAFLRVEVVEQPLPSSGAADGERVALTGWDGTIELISDGSGLWVKPDR